jgi:ADP-ribose pyrophosphatase YjhB (NUDIX family)
MLWNIPAGYLDYGESVEQAAQREAYEETGVVVPLEKIEMMGINSRPGGRRQDVSVRFSAVLDGTTDDYPVDISHCEPGEVNDAGWIPLSKLGDKRWAFGQFHKIVPQAETMFGNLNGNGRELSNMIAELKHELSGNPKAKYLFNTILKMMKAQQENADV